MLEGTLVCAESSLNFAAVGRSNAVFNGRFTRAKQHRCLRDSRRDMASNGGVERVVDTYDVK